jgi:hypothetical protein
VRSPIANIQGLINLFNFESPNDPRNAEVLSKLHTMSETLDKVIREIVQSTKDIQPMKMSQQ